MSRQQEEIISQLREQLQERRDSESENVLLKQKMKALEGSLQRIITHPQYKDIFGSGGGERGLAGNNNKMEEKKGPNPRTKLQQFYSPDKNDIIALSNPCGRGRPLISTSAECIKLMYILISTF
jgi:hypothetical protein